MILVSHKESYPLLSLKVSNGALGSVSGMYEHVLGEVTPINQLALLPKSLPWSSFCTFMQRSQKYLGLLIFGMHAHSFTYLKKENRLLVGKKNGRIIGIGNIWHLNTTSVNFWN